MMMRVFTTPLKELAATLNLEVCLMAGARREDPEAYPEEYEAVAAATQARRITHCRAQGG